MTSRSRCRRQPGPQRARWTSGSKPRAYWQAHEKDRGSHAVRMAASHRQGPHHGCARGGGCRPDLAKTA